MNALARTSSNCEERMLYKDYDRCSIEKILAVSLKGLDAKTN
jgi:hypothetical protein